MTPIWATLSTATHADGPGSTAMLDERLAGTLHGFTKDAENSEARESVFNNTSVRAYLVNDNSANLALHLRVQTARGI